MKLKKSFVMIGASVAMMAAMSVSVFAASQYTTPAEAVAGLTGREVQSVIDERTETGKSYGTIAAEAGVLDEFKNETLEMKKDQLAKRVADGTMTQEQADAIIARLEANQATCDGSGSAGTGRNAGAGFGMGSRQGGGQGGGQGKGAGTGRGMGSCNGTCLTQ